MKREEKKELIKKFGRKPGDTGSPEVQIAIFTSRIEALKEHLSLHKKDNSSRRGMILMIGKRRRLLQYLKKTNPEKYSELITQLGIRK